MRGGDKKGRDVEFSREEFPNNLQTVTVAVEEGSDKRDQGPIQCSGGQVWFPYWYWLQFWLLEKNGKPGVGVVDKFDSGGEKRVLS